MKVIAMIPARYAASRFPGKLMAMLGGKTVIQRTYEAVLATNLFDEIYVVSDSEIIKNELDKIGARVIMSQKQHETGSDRIAEAVENIDADIVVNVQGDEPFTRAASLQKLIEVFENDIEAKVDLASLKQKIESPERVENPNVVKVICDREDFALYFSRSPIPYPREESRAVFYEHVGVYAFRKQALLDFTKLEMLNNEAAEKIEAIRYLEYGKKIKMIEIQDSPIGINTPEDLEQAKKYLGL